MLKDHKAASANHDGEPSPGLDSDDSNDGSFTGSGGFRLRLISAFAAASLFTIAITAVAMLSFDRFSSAFGGIIEDTVPRVVTALELAERTALLTAFAPRISAAGDEKALEATELVLQGLRQDTDTILARLRSRIAPRDLEPIQSEIGQLQSNLDRLFVLRAQSLRSARERQQHLDDLSRTQADLTDTFHPVSYGNKSLMRLRANRTSRQVNRAVRDLITRNLIRLRGLEGLEQVLRHARDDLALLATMSTVQLDQFDTKNLQGLQDVATGAGLSNDVDVRPILERAQAVLADPGDAGARQRALSSVLVDLQRTREGFSRELTASLSRMEGRISEGHLQLVNQALAEGRNAAEIQALANHLISLLQTVATLDTTEEVRAVRAVFDGKADGYRLAIQRFNASGLAERNPVLRGKVQDLAGEVTAAAHGQSSMFKQRLDELVLFREVTDLLVQNQQISKRVSEIMGRLVPTQMSQMQARGSELNAILERNRLILIITTFIALLCVMTVAWGAYNLVRRREAQLRAAREEAEAANQAKSRFLSSMSHELRTPLNAVLGFSQLLRLESGEGALTQNQQASVGQIYKSGRHLLDLIEQVLDLSKIEIGQIQVSICPCDHSEIVEDCFRQLSVMAAEKSIFLENSLDCNERVEVLADKVRLRQIMLNLLSNAIKYNQDNGVVRVVQQEDPEQRRLRICVVDTGPGIAESLQPDLFKPFSRLGAESTNIEGTGIGLTICKMLAEAMNGAIGYETTPGRGSTFWVELPMTVNERPPEPAASSGPLVPVGWTPSGARSGPPDDPDKSEAILVLYIEDNPSNLLLMETILRRYTSLELISAHNAEIGIELARARKPDLILMDLNLPGLDGFEALRVLRDNPAAIMAPVIAISADVTETTFARVNAAGFAAFIAKPLQVDQAVTTIENALGGLLKSNSVQAAPGIKQMPASLAG